MQIKARKQHPKIDMRHSLAPVVIDNAEAAANKDRLIESMERSLRARQVPAAEIADRVAQARRDW